MNPTTGGAADPPLQRLLEQVRDAHARAAPLCIRGTATKDFYGGPLQGTPLELAPLRGITSYEPTEMVVTARAGTPLAELESVLAERGQCLAFEPPRFGSGGTVGGMVAAGLAGPARASVGGVRDFVLGATMINGRGELLEFGGQVMKNVAGFDVSRVLAGSMGVLGVIAQVSLKVPPVAAARQTLLLEMPQDRALQLMHACSAAALPLRASAWQRQQLHLRLEGAVAAVQASAARLQSQHGARLLAPDAARAFWDDLRDQRSEFFQRTDGLALWRLSVPSLCPPLQLEGETLIEWGGAQRWVRSAESGELLRRRAHEAGGHATAFGAFAQREAAFAPVAPAIERLHRALKASFDPAGIFNPGRLYPWL